MSATLLTSAITPTQPAMTAALACAPLIPPRPEVTKTYNEKKHSKSIKYYEKRFMEDSGVFIPFLIDYLNSNISCQHLVQSTVKHTRIINPINTQ